VSLDRRQVAAALPAYEIGAELGRGRFGVVFGATHRRLGRPAAIKAMALTPEAGADEAQRFLTEARILSEIDHPHIVRIFDYHETDELCLIVMERMEATLRREAGRLAMPPDVVSAVGIAVGSAIATAHDHRVLHRDIKPDNLLVARDGTVKVADFGIAKIIEETVLSANTLIGTPIYMAPEQLTGERLGAGTDVYALGVVLYELFAGRSPIPRDIPMAQLFDPARLSAVPPLDRVARVPGPVAAVVARAMRPALADRHPTARSFAIDLARAGALAFGPGWLSSCPVRVLVEDDIRRASETPRPLTTPLAPPTEPVHAVPPAPPAAPAPVPPAPPVQSVPSVPPAQSVPPVQSVPAIRPADRSEAMDGPTELPRSGGSGGSGPGRSPDYPLPPLTPGLPPSATYPPFTPVAGSAADLDFPAALALSPSGALLVARPTRNRVDVVMPNGQIGVLAGTGRAGRSGDGGPAWRADLDNPSGICVDRLGVVYIADTFAGRIRRIGPDGVITSLGTPTSRGSDPGPRRARGIGPLLRPRGVAVAPDGTVYVADTDNHRIVRLSAAGGASVIAGTGIAGFFGDGGPALDAELNRPHALALEPSGALLIADTGNRRVRRILPARGGRGLADDDREIVTVVGAAYGPPVAAGPGRGAVIGRPHALVVDPAGFVFIADPDTHRVWMLSPDGSLTTAVGTGRPGAGGDGRLGTEAELDRPHGLALVGDGTLFIADLGNHRLRIVSRDGRIATLGAR